MPEIACKVGEYAMDDGASLIVLAATDTADSLAYVLADREGGELDRATDDRFVETLPRTPLTFTFGACGTGDLTLARAEGAPVSGRRVPYPEAVIAFAGDGVTLSGKLVLPVDGTADTVIVWVTGSDQIGDVDRTEWQYLLPRQGVGVFILDKRGTGGSSGSQTANFYLRADDVAAAVRELRGLLGPEVRIGLFGVSQGGWVAPLTASRTAVDFVIVGYGMAEGVTAEDREEIVQNLQAAGFGPSDISQAMELQAAATRIVTSHWTEGWEAFDALRTKYRDAPWIAAMGQEGYTGFMIAAPTDQLKIMGPRLDLGVSFDYDPAPVVAGLDTPQLWILGGKDIGAPSARTREIIEDLQRSHRRIDLAVVPEADHGIIERSELAGVRHIRSADGYWTLVAAWARSGAVPALPESVVVSIGAGF